MARIKIRLIHCRKNKKIARVEQQVESSSSVHRGREKHLQPMTQTHNYLETILLL